VLGQTQRGGYVQAPWSLKIKQPTDVNLSHS
jgi:hypothetical protein